MLYQSCQVVFELFSILIPKNQYFAEEISIFPRGNNMTKKNTFLPHMPAADLAFFQGGASSTSRVAASRFFLRILNPRKWCFPGNWNVRLNQKLYHECFRPYNAVILGLEKLGNTASPGAWIHKRLVFFRLDVSLNVICAAMSNRKIRTT